MPPSNDARPAFNAPVVSAVFALSEAVLGEELLTRIGAHFRLRGHRPSESRRVHLDTPDWRLRRSGAELTRLGNGRAESIELCTREDARAMRQALDAEPAFAWDLPAGPLRERVEPIVGVRRLLPQVEVRAQLRSFDVLDEREKIVVRMELEEGRALSRSEGQFHSLGTVLRLRPLRGYESAFEALAQFLGRELGLLAVPAGDLGRALAATGRDPRAEVVRWRVDLSPRESSGRAVRRVLGRFLENMLACEAGLRADVDTEYLHEFRVAVRRSRSILGQMGAVFAPEVVERAALDLAWLGSVTTWLRDLDVFVLQIRQRMRQGDELWSQFDSVRDSIEAARARELERVREALDSERWQRFRASWSAELGRAIATNDPAPSREPIVQLASKHIAHLHRKVLKASKRLTLESPASDWHRLRIRCKKLRYMTDAFGCLYAEKGRRRLVRRLKRLQGLLGELNDLSVQVETLGRFTTELEGLTPACLFAMGRLSERYRSRSSDLQPEILERLAEFADDQDRARVKRLLARPAE